MAGEAGGGAFEVVGWMFTAQDMASSVATQANETVQTAASGIESSLDSTAALVESRSSSIVKATSWIARGVARSFANVFGDAAGSGAYVMLTSIEQMVDGVIGLGKRWVEFGERTVPSAVSAAFAPVKALGKLMFKTQFSFLQLPAAIGKIGKAAFSMGRSFASAAVQGKDLLSNLLGIKDVGAAGKAAGAGGLLGGLFGGAFKLLTPIINLLQKVFEPLISGIMDHLSNALGPLQMTMELIAQDLGPKIAKLIVPFVGILEIIVSHLGTILSDMLDTGPAVGFVTQVMGTLAKVFQDLLPVAQTIVTTLMGTLIDHVLPTVMGLVNALLPVLGEVVKLIAGTLAEVLPEIGKIWGEVGPLLVETFEGLLKAVLPVVPSLLKLVAALAKLAAPFIASALIGVLEIVKAITPAIEQLAGWLSELADVASKAIGDMLEEWGGFETFVLAFKIGLGKLFDQIEVWVDSLAEWMVAAYDSVMHFWSGSGIKEDIIDPMVNYIPDKIGGMFDAVSGKASAFWRWAMDLGTEALSWVGNMAKSILEMMGLSDIGSAAEGVIQGAIAALTAPVEALKAFLNEWLIGPINEIMGWDPPLIPGDTLAGLVGLGEGWTVPQLAAGGVTTDTVVQRGGMIANVGEAGQELILPLQPQVIQASLAPALEGIQMPGVQQVVRVLESIDRRLAGVLRVDGGDMNTTQQARPQPRGASLEDAVGIGGI
jgi:phage-related protein